MCEQKTADSPAHAAGADLKSLELLYDYTKFHIGVYLTLTGAYITLATAKIGDESLLPKIHPYLAGFAIFFFVLAGIGGGMVGSNIPTSGCTSAAQYMKQQLRLPWWHWLTKRKTFTAGTWVSIEHGAFWLGIVLAILSFAFHRTAPEPSHSGAFHSFRCHSLSGECYRYSCPGPAVAGSEGDSRCLSDEALAAARIGASNCHRVG
jgi:hypothetical protein